jgi:hypothetical protein
MVIRRLALHSDTLSSSTVGVKDRGVVYTHIYLTILRLEQPLLLCLL